MRRGSSATRSWWPRTGTPSTGPHERRHNPHYQFGRKRRPWAQLPARPACRNGPCSGVPVPRMYDLFAPYRGTTPARRRAAWSGRQDSPNKPSTTLGTAERQHGSNCVWDAVRGHDPTSGIRHILNSCLIRLHRLGSRSAEAGSTPTHGCTPDFGRGVPGTGHQERRHNLLLLQVLNSRRKRRCGRSTTHRPAGRTRSRARQWWCGFHQRCVGPLGPDRPDIDRGPPVGQ